jgi:hypothetical protein
MFRHSPVSIMVIAEAGDHAVRVDMRPVIQEELLDDVRFVAEAKHEIAVAVLAVEMHEVPEDRFVADRDHRLRDGLGVVANSGAEAAAKQDRLHFTTSLLEASAGWRQADLSFVSRASFLVSARPPIFTQCTPTMAAQTSFSSVPMGLPLGAEK